MLAVAVEQGTILDNEMPEQSNLTSTSTLLTEGVPLDDADDSYLLAEAQRIITLTQYRFGVAFVILVTLSVVIFFDDYFGENEWGPLLIYVTVSGLWLWLFLIEYENILWSAVVRRGTISELTPRVACVCILKLLAAKILFAVKVLAWICVLLLCMVIFYHVKK